MKFKAPFSVLMFLSFYCTYAQDSNIQIYTPSKLMQSGQWDVKWFNNLYTETLSINDKKETLSSPRRNFFTSSLDVFTGLNAVAIWNVGVHLEYRSNTIDGLDLLAPFSFKERPEQRRGLTRIAPAIKVAPFSDLTNFSIQSSFSIPLFDEEDIQGVYLDQKGYVWQNKAFYDYSSSNGSFQVFSELNLEYNFGEKDASYANDSLRLSPGVFVSYFPSQNFTVLALIQHSSLIPINNDFSQNYSAIGAGLKYQINQTLNIEGLYTNFIRGNSTGLGKTINLGLRAVIN
jgi:hypothetical protein